MHQLVKQVLSLAITLSVTCTIPTVWANHHEHEAIPDLDMAAMTMAFRVADTISIDKLKAGDKIRFSLGQVQGKWVVVAIENDTSP